MLIIKQKGYDDFHCIAQDCPESCCKFWQIYSDEASLEKYRTLSKTDERIRNTVNQKEGCFLQKNGICSFLDDDELCYLQKTYGESMLCDTCRNYPRHVEEFENVREYSLSLSCPHAAKTFLDDPDPVSFEEFEDDKDEEFEEFDCLLYDHLVEVRELLLEIASDRSAGLAHRLRILCDLAAEHQELMDEGRIFETDVLQEKYRQKMKEADPGKCWFDLFDFDYGKDCFKMLNSLETLHDDWKSLLNRTEEYFFGGNGFFLEEFDRYVKEYETVGEKILVLFLITYFCGAVYDGYAKTKTLLSVFSVAWIFYIAYSTDLSKETLIRTAWQYAREIEHSDLNLDAIEEWFLDFA